MRQCSIFNAFLISSCVSIAHAQCPQVTPQFYSDGFDNTVRDLLEHDDGGGPALYACGDFLTAEREFVERIARWDGTRWTRVGAGANASIGALQRFAATGPADLYSAGAFTQIGGFAANRVA